MTKRVLTVDWKAINGSTVKKRILHLKGNADSIFLCPIQVCLHVGFKSSRGLRKHINTVHPWYYYFDEQPLINRNDARVQEKSKIKSCTHKMPAFSLHIGVGKEFLEWLQTPCGGGKSTKEATHIGRRAMKFLMASLGDPEGDTTVKEEYIDCCVGSPAIVINFLKLITEEWELRSSAALTYMKAVSDLLDFRKANGVSDNTLRSFAVTEVYIRRGKENLTKQKNIEYARNLDLETLISRNSWASIQEMEEVIPYHTPKYEYVLKKCKSKEQPPTVSQLSFATRFIATFLFLRVKCTRPMTYQFLTLKMVADAKENGGFVDQTAFKTSDKYAFDTLVLSDDVLNILDTYVKVVRPVLNPSCDYLLITNNGTQYHAFGMAMSLLVHQAIGKSVNPTRYRQIVESESASQLSEKEREVISKDQKHSSYVAKRMYQKRLSRDVAVEGMACMQKIVGHDREKHTSDLASSLQVIHNPRDVNSSLRETAISMSPGFQKDNVTTLGDDDNGDVSSAQLVLQDNELMHEEHVDNNSGYSRVTNATEKTSQAPIIQVDEEDESRHVEHPCAEAKELTSNICELTVVDGDDNCVPPTYAGIDNGKSDIEETISSTNDPATVLSPLPYVTIEENYTRGKTVTNVSNNVHQSGPICTKSKFSNMHCSSMRPEEEGTAPQEKTISRTTRATSCFVNDYAGGAEPVATSSQLSVAMASDGKNALQGDMDVEVKKEEAEKEIAKGIRLIRFSTEEDTFLKEGVRKYGPGKWSFMLRDQDLKFHHSRTRDSLRMRADTIGISAKRKGRRKKCEVR